MEELVARFGLLAVFLGTAVEGDLGLILGGVAAHLGLDGPARRRRRGRARRLLRRRRLVRDRTAQRRRPPPERRLPPRRPDDRAPRRRASARCQILLARPVYGTRVASMLFWGTQRLVARPLRRARSPGVRGVGGAAGVARLLLERQRGGARSARSAASRSGWPSPSWSRSSRSLCRGTLPARGCERLRRIEQSALDRSVRARASARPHARDRLRPRVPRRSRSPCPTAACCVVEIKRGTLSRVTPRRRA